MNIDRSSLLAFALATGVATFGCSHTSTPPPSQDNSPDSGGSQGSSSGGTTDGGAARGATDGAAAGSGTDGAAAAGSGTDGAAAGSGTDGAAAGSGTDGAAAGSGTDGAAAGSGTDGAAAGDATNMGGAADGGGAEEEASGGGPSGPPPPASACSQTAIWGTGTELAISAPSDNNLGAITPDELTIAWTIGTGSSAVIAYADRAAETDAFGEPQTLSASSFADDRVAVSADGLRLVVVNADRQGFSEMTRTARTGTGSTFGAASVGSYSNYAGTLATTTEAFGDPVLSADDEAFYYSIYGRPGQTSTIARATRLTATDAWPVGALLPATPVLAEEQEEVTLRRRPTAISSDEQTLFYWDEVSGTERATWLDTSTGVFTVFVDLGARQWANPNLACTRLYYSEEPAGPASSDGAATLDLFVASD